MRLDPTKLNDVFDLDDEPTFSEENQTLQIETSKQDTTPKINHKKVYEELAELIKNGNDILSTTKLMIESDPDAEMVHASAQLLSSIKDMMKEYTKLYLNEVKFDQRKEIEQMKFQAKQEELSFKLKASKALLQDRQNLQVTSQNMPNSTDAELVPYSQEQAVFDIIQQEKQQNSKENTT